MDIQGLSKVRLRVLTQVLTSGEIPFDVIFVKMNDNILMTLVNIKGDFPASHKHEVRKEIVDKLLKGAIPQTQQASELVYFSFDHILNIDYCFEVFPKTRKVNLFIFSTSGRHICSFTPFNPNTDERIEIERLLKSTNECQSTLSVLKEKFSKLLENKKPKPINFISLEEPITIKIDDCGNQPNPKGLDSIHKQQEDTSSYINNILKKLDNSNFQMKRDSHIEGSAIISIGLSIFVSQFSEWNGLFDFKTDNTNVLVICKKGFEDEITQMAIPYLWKRKSFIENCIIFGVEKIVFIDPINKTFDLIEISTIAPNTLK